MKKGILLAVLAVILIGVVVYAIWYINEQGKMHVNNKDSFIPYNSALVVSVNGEPHLSAEMKKAFRGEIENFQRKLLPGIADTLRAEGYVMSYPYVMAMRVEGKNKITYLYVMDNKEVLSRNEIPAFLNQAFAAGAEKVRKYDRYKIYTLQQGKEHVYFAVCGGIVLISDSDLYIEDGLKQYDLEETNGETKPHYQNINKYLSATAGINVFLNTSVFTDVLPLYVQTKKLLPGVDVTKLFKWGALDGEINEEGVCLNGFLHYEGLEKSYIRTLGDQQPKDSKIDGVIPARIMAAGMLNLSNPALYFPALEAWRYSTGRKNAVYNRKQQYVRMFGKEHEQELQKLLQGEFAMVDLSYNEATQEKDGLIMAVLKSGGLGKNLLEQMLQHYARFDKTSVESYSRKYSIDKEKSFTYYRFPVEDIAALYWGDIFEGIKSRYVLIEDNNLVFASSDKAMKSFITDYVHGSFMRDAEWYQNLKNKLSGKHTLSYFARTSEMLPFYQTLMKGEGQAFLSGNMDGLSVFPTFALQWSNEGGMLYNTLFLSTLAIQEEIRPHVLWQTKLEAKVSMKPVPVVNHVTGEWELFVQDERNMVYLINSVGRVLWKVPVDGKINSEVYQVDLFKNGKLQYLFSTSAKMYLIDRNGNAAGKFPLTFRAQCDQGISVFDYDNTKDYRIFAPCADRKVYLYGLDGNFVKGWEPENTDKPVVTRVQHYRVEGKDYIVFADRYRIYILDRRGKERVRVSSVFDLSERSNIYLAHNAAGARLVFLGTEGNVYSVNFDGKTESFKVAGVTAGTQMNVADVNNDKLDECIFSDGDRLWVCNMQGKIMWEKKIDAEALHYPYIYRFSESDVRIGVLDTERAQVFLLTSEGNVSKGFPIAGDSPFSIVFFGQDGFFLFAGADNGTLIKYKVQR